jgi:hypothetical protein
MAAGHITIGGRYGTPARTAARQANQEQLAAARAAADKATAELVALAQRLAEIAEVPEPPQRSRLGRAWGWFLRN